MKEGDVPEDPPEFCFTNVEDKTPLEDESVCETIFKSEDRTTGSLREVRKQKKALEKSRALLQVL